MFISRVNRSRQDYWVFLDQNARKDTEIEKSESTESSSYSSSSISSESSLSSNSSSSISSESSSSSSPGIILSSSSSTEILTSSSSSTEILTSSSSSSTEILMSSSSSTEILTSSSSSSSFGYCNNELGAEGFSISAYNGIYTVTGEHNSKPYWTNDGGKFIFYTTGGSFWCMAGSLGGLTTYRNSIDGILCPYGSGCANYETWPGGSPAGIICSGEVSSSSSSL